MLIDVREKHDHQITRNEEEKEKCQKWKGVDYRALPIL